MLSELRNKAQVTIPREIVLKLGLSQGDKLEVFEREGVIHMLPVVVYPRQTVDALKEELSQVRANIALGKQPVFNSVDALMQRLEGE